MHCPPPPLSARLLSIEFATSVATGLTGATGEPNRALAQSGDQGPPDWHRVETYYLAVSLPPGWEHIPQQGIDLYVGQFGGDGIRLVFEPARRSS